MSKTMKTYGLHYIMAMLGWLCVAESQPPGQPTATAPPGKSSKTEREARTQRLQMMRDRVAATKVSLKHPSGHSQTELIAEPIMRYDDQPRRFVDATLWLWMSNRQPVAVCKVEDVRPATGRPIWQTCLSSLAASKVEIEWPNTRRWASRASVEYHVIPDGPVAAESPRLRLVQMKDLVRRFSAVMILGQDRQSMRLLPSPVYRYEAPESQVQDAALFAITANGTNPDGLLLIELHETKSKQAEWRYAVAPVTADGMELRLDNSIVWRKVSTPLTGGETHFYFTEHNSSVSE